MDSNREIIKEYSKGDLTVIWKPKTCIHAAECVKRLPEVYKPDEKPWIQLENATADELKAQIDACPSGALSYRLSNKQQETAASAQSKVQVKPNGPLLVFGNLEINHSDGSAEMKSKVTAFCRCGASANKPYCDGAHNKVDFTG